MVVLKTASASIQLLDLKCLEGPSPGPLWVRRELATSYCRDSHNSTQFLNISSHLMSPFSALHGNASCNWMVCLKGWQLFRAAWHFKGLRPSTSTWRMCTYLAWNYLNLSGGLPCTSCWRHNIFCQPGGSLSDPGSPS